MVENKIVGIENIVRILRNGQITIPEETRKYLDLNPGDMIKIKIEKEIKV